MFKYFNNEALRKLVVGFGNLFNDVYTGKYDSDGNLLEKNRVPLTYGPKEKFIRRIQEVSTISDTVRTEITLPRMGFDIGTIAYDNSRKRNTMQKRFVAQDGNNYKVQRTFAEVPYNFDFNLYIMTRNMDDGLQILEQIVPYFTPEFNVSLNLQSDIATKIDVPIILTSVESEEEYEGDFDVRLSITWTLRFTVKSYVYGAIREQGVIRDVQTTFFNYDNLDPDYGIYGATGGTGAFSRVDVSATGPDAGPTGAGVGIGGYTTDFAHDLYVFGYTAGVTGGPGINIRGNTV